jgi:hypothetical protein
MVRARVSIVVLVSLVVIPLAAAQGVQSRTPPQVEITVDANTIVNTMRGGIGASWHAIEKPIPIGHGGSGWGAYPPAEDERAWQQVYRHAEWLGLDWNRVEIEQRVYEPERGKFTFDTPEMRILYRVLDWNQQHGADVFFQQMWVNADWLAYPAARKDAIARVHSAPEDLDAFADGLAALMEHLIRKRGYTCIKWLSITNEPGANWGWWNDATGKPLPIGAGLEAVRTALAKRGLNLPLSGPDAGMEYFNTVLEPDEAIQLGAYDFHDYGIHIDARSGGFIEKQVRAVSDLVKFAHAQNKPVFLSEFGTLDWPIAPRDTRPTAPDAVLAGAEFVIRDANAGVDGFNRWSFLNRGDLDGEWQFLNTWDTAHSKLLAEFTPHPNSYFGLGLMSRFIAKHSDVLRTTVSNARMQNWQRVFCAAFRSPAGNVTVAVMNDAPEEFALKFAWAGAAPASRFHRYRFGKGQFGRADVNVEPEREFAATPGAGWTEILPGESLTIYSTYELKMSDSGVIVDEKRK